MAITRADERTTDAADYFAAKLSYEASPSELKETLDRAPHLVFVVDVRPREAFDAGHIPNARSVPMEDLAAAYAALPKNRTVVTYCGDISCGLSLRAALQLAQKGFRVKRLLGGLAEWSRRGFPVEATPPPPEPEC